VHAALAKQTTRLVDWIGPDGNKPEVLRRLSEVATQQNLMQKFPDQYWAYRSQVKEHLTKRPRSQIRQASHDNEGEHDPEDRRRMDYFTTLGQAAKSKQVDDIRAVADFETPFDPMLSFFLHLEIAELYARARHPELEAELRHRLHAVYFSSPT